MILNAHVETLKRRAKEDFKSRHFEAQPLFIIHDLRTSAREPCRAKKPYQPEPAGLHEGHQLVLDPFRLTTLSSGATQAQAFEHILPEETVRDHSDKSHCNS